MNLTLPPLHYFFTLIEKCREARNLSQALRTHIYICYHGTESHQDLSRELISLFILCGNFPLSLQLFNKLEKRDEFAWISMVLGFCSHGNPQFSLILNQEMEKYDGISSTRHTFMALVKVCITLGRMDTCYRIHDEITKKGIEQEEEPENDVCVANALIDMYAKCGSILDAQEIFNRIKARNVISWTTLICGYVEHGYFGFAIELCNTMRSEGVSLNVVTYMCGLKACSIIGSMEIGENLHIEILKRGLENANRQRIGHILVTFYIKSGMFEEALKVSDMLLVRNEVVWSSLVAGYASHGYDHEALCCFESMLLDGALPNSITYVSCLKACGSIGALRKGSHIHAQIVSDHVPNNVSIGCALVDMYLGCNSLERAHVVFDYVLVRDVALWNALMNGYSEHGMDDKAWVFLEQMRIEGVNPDHETLACCIRACSSLGDKVKGQELHIHICKKGFDDEVMSSALVDMYGKCDLLPEAYEVFSKMKDQDVVSWTSLIVGFSENGIHSEKAATCFRQMLSKGISPDAFSIASALKCCISSRVLEFGQQLHMLVFQCGYEDDEFVANMLVEMYAKCGLLVDAQQAFNKLLIRGVMSWSVMITSFVDRGEHTKAFSLYAQMQEHGVPPDSMTFLGILRACSVMGTSQIGREVHTHVWKVGWDYGEVFLMNALIDMYAKSGNMIDAEYIFNAMPIKDLVSWNTWLVGCSNQKRSNDVLNIFESMKEAGISPDDVSLLTILSACSHLGLVDAGKKYYEEMRSKYGIPPTIKHQTCMVELLCNDGQLDVAVEMAPSEGNIVAWTSVLHACRECGNSELGRETFHNVVRGKA